jgi:hypothetical protein
MNNTKTRHLEILTACKEILTEVGGVMLVDSLQQDERVPLLRGMAKQVAEDTNCHIDTAKRNVAKALRLARGEIVGQWGGKRG